MAAKTDGYANLWPQKEVNWHLKMVGLDKNRLLGKYLLWSRCSFLLFSFICMCQQVYGIGVQFVEGSVTIAQRIIPFQFMLIFAIIAEETYTFIYRQAVAKECVENSTEPLHSLSCVGGAMILKKHMFLFKFLLITHVWSVYGAVVIIVIISPLLRFGFNFGSSSFVVYPIWYPVDVLSTRYLFWSAFVYESLMIGAVGYTHNNRNVVFLYLFTMTQVRLDALSRFLRTITRCRDLGLRIRRRKPQNSVAKEKIDITQQDLKLETIATSNVKRHISKTFVDFHHEKLEKLKIAVIDLYKLRRQTKLINSTFRVYFSICHAVSFSSTVVMFLAMANEVRKPERTLTSASTEIFMYAFVGITSVIQICTIHYIADLIQQSSLIESWRIFLFLYQITAQK